MAINVDHTQYAQIAPAIAPAIAGGIGAQQRQQADMLAIESERQRQQLQQRQIEFTYNAQQQAAQQWQRQQQLNQQSALQAQSQAAQQASQRASIESDLLQAAMQDQNVLQQLEMQQQAQRDARGEQEFEGQIAQQMSELNRVKLTDQGRQILGKFSTRLAEIRGQRSSLRPDVYNDILGQWAADFQAADIYSHEIKQPTQWDRFKPMQGQQIVPDQPLAPGMYMRNTGVRAGEEVWEPWWEFGAEGPPTKIAANGTTLIMGRDGEYVPLPDPKPPAAEKPDPNAITTPVYLDTYNQVAKRLMDQAIAKQQASIRMEEGRQTAGDALVPPTHTEIDAATREQLAAAGGGGQGGIGETLMGALGALGGFLGGGGGGQVPPGAPPAAPPAAAPPAAAPPAAAPQPPAQIPELTREQAATAGAGQWFTAGGRRFYVIAPGQFEER